MKNWLAVVSVGVMAGFAASAVADDDHDHNSRQRVFRAQLVGFNEVPSRVEPGAGGVLRHRERGGHGVHVLADLLGPRVRRVRNRISTSASITRMAASASGCARAPPFPRRRRVAANVPTARCAGTTTPITATITAADVVGPAGQGIAAGGVRGAPGRHARRRCLRERAFGRSRNRDRDAAGRRP